jgi:hypothetical protein
VIQKRHIGKRVPDSGQDATMELKNHTGTIQADSIKGLT